MFTWKPIYKELAQKLLAYRDKQKELIAILSGLQKDGFKVISLKDKAASNHECDLDEIDPFTFFASFNRGTKDENRIGVLRRLKDLWGMESDLPTDFAAIPVVYQLQSWFFPWKYERSADDISSLWDLAAACLTKTPSELDAKLFERCLRIVNVGSSKLTMGLFWFNPDRYLPLDSRTNLYLEGKGITVPTGKDLKLADYITLVHDVSERIGPDFVDISYRAFTVTDTERKRYWAGGFLWGGQESHLDEFIRGSFWQHGYDRQSTDKAAQEVWGLFDQIRIGDEFAIKGLGGKNDLNVHFIGKVTKIIPDEGKVLLEKLERSLYSGKGPKGSGAGNWHNTLLEVKRTDLIRQVFDPVDKKSTPGDPTISLNLILYGPPGTGKTYKATHLAVQIVDGKLPDGGDLAIQARFRQLNDDGRIQVVTFHQSFGYEEFVEGIRPSVEETSEGDRPVFDYRDGVFKRMAHQALHAALMPTAEKAALDEFEARWRRLAQVIGDDPDREYEGLTAKTTYRFELTPHGNIRGHNTKNPQGAVLLCSLKNLRKVYLANKDRPTLTTSEVNEALGVGSHTNLAAVIFRELQKLKPDASHAKTAPEYADLKDANLEVLARGDALRRQIKSGQEAPRYVLVVDEINRGNVSRILGELITLLEADKRLGADHQFVVTLPYTSEPFGVPPNLFVIGTMNTADKSIALVDVALRRRFEFQECMPDFSTAVCPHLTEQMRQVLMELNLRIALRKDREHQIGHSYFIEAADEDGFNCVFRRKILPLLQEYFYNDWDGLRFVLGDVKDQGEFVVSLRKEQKYARNQWEWNLAVWQEDFKFLDTLMVNYSIVEEPAANA
ncbi:MAG: AAA family ATPase [Kiritimatiellia bacterium]|nr:AAA family ATPase [Kiritimatiellia bacterium]